MWCCPFSVWAGSSKKCWFPTTEGSHHPLRAAILLKETSMKMLHFILTPPKCLLNILVQKLSRKYVKVIFVIYMNRAIEKCANFLFQSLRKLRNQVQNISLFFWTPCSNANISCSGTTMMGSTTSCSHLLLPYLSCFWQNMRQASKVFVVNIHNTFICRSFLF